MESSIPFIGRKTHFDQLFVRFFANIYDVSISYFKQGGGLSVGYSEEEFLMAREQSGKGIEFWLNGNQFNKAEYMEAWGLKNLKLQNKSFLMK